MLRFFVIGFNTSIAAGMGVASGWLILQFTLNRVWEEGFYGVVSPVTQAFLWAGVLVLVLSVITIIATLGYVARYRWGMHAIFGLSIIFLWSLPSPLSWFALLCAITVILEAGASRLPPEETGEG
jgi:predicted Co/Zn/Cd cation transporter (cation efflux family)